MEPNVQFKSTKYRKKELCEDNSVQESIGDVYCPTSENEKCVCISTKKRLVITTVKNAKASARVQIILLKTKN